MTCKRCQSPRIADVTAKCSDLCFVSIPGFSEHDGYVPSFLGGGDYVRLSICLECGQVQQDFPITDEQLEAEEEFKKAVETELP